VIAVRERFDLWCQLLQHEEAISRDFYTVIILDSPFLQQTPQVPYEESCRTTHLWAMLILVLEYQMLFV